MGKLLISNYIKEWPQILAVLIASISMMNYGSLIAWASPSIAKLIDKNHPLQITYDQASYLTVLPPISTIIVAVPVSLLVDKKGRKFTLLFATLPYLLSWILIAIGNSIWTFYAARLISGIGDACVVASTSILVGEVTVPSVRGKWGNSLVLLTFVGILCAYAAGGFLDISTTAYIFIALPVISFVLLCCIPESPYFLIMQNKNEEAKKSLQWFRQGQNIDTEFNEITEVVKRQTSESGQYRDIFLIPSNRKAMIATICTRVSQQFSGTSAFLVYAQTMFDIAGGNISSTISALICGVIQLFFSGIGAIIVGRMGRRIALFNSAIGCIIVLILMTIYFYLDTNTDVDVSVISWFPLVGMIAFLIIFSLGLSLVPTLICGELFSSSIKGKAMAINNIVMAACIGGTTKIFQVLSEFGLFAPFLFYAVMCSIFTTICYFVTPETKGKTLDEIQLAFKAPRTTKTRTMPC